MPRDALPASASAGAYQPLLQTTQRRSAITSTLHQTGSEDQKWPADDHSSSSRVGWLLSGAAVTCGLLLAGQRAFADEPAPNPEIHDREPKQKGEVQIFRIVLTGGPCAGKSSAMSLIARRLMSLGFQVFLVPGSFVLSLSLPSSSSSSSCFNFLFLFNDQETAALVINGGGLWKHPAQFTIRELITFEAAMIKMQMAIEDSFYQLAKACGKPAVILCDRGVMDCCAYMTPQSIALMCDEQGWTQVQLRDRRYEAIVHLISTSFGAEEHFTLSNNTARSETLEEAREMDIKTLQAWVGHPNLSIIDNSTDYDNKVRRAAARICRIIGLPTPSGTRRKFLLRGGMPTVPLPVQEFESETFFLKQKPGRPGFSFLRCRGQNGIYSYTYSTRVSSPDGQTAISEKQISSSEFVSLSDRRDPNFAPLRRTHRVFVYANTYYELIHQTSPHDGLIILLTETENPDSPVIIPPFLQRMVDREVTNDQEYTSHFMAHNTPPGNGAHESAFSD
ncbi:MAG: ATP-binding protein [archaeon]|nr:ATP-binding protein [archaeon]